MMLRSHRRPVWPGLAVLALLLTGSSLAQAQTAAVLGIGGDAASPLASEVADILLNAVENNPDLEAVDRTDLDVSEALMFLGCSDITDSCLRELAFTLEVDRVLYGAIRQEAGETELDVRYFDSTNNENLLDQTFPFQATDDRTELEMRLAAAVSNSVVLRVNADRAGVEVYVDDVLLGEAPIVSMDLSPGRHTLVASCDGCDDFQRVIELQRGQAFTQTVELGTVASNGGDDDDDDHDTSSGGRNIVLPTTLTAVGGALIITGVAFGFIMESTQDDFDQTPSLNEAEDLADKGDRQALMANVFLATGAAVAVTGIVLFFVLDDEEDTPPMTEVRAAPYVGPNAAGFVLEGRF